MSKACACTSSAGRFRNSAPKDGRSAHHKTFSAPGGKYKTVVAEGFINSPRYQDVKLSLTIPGVSALRSGRIDLSRNDSLVILSCTASDQGGVGEGVVISRREQPLASPPRRYLFTASVTSVESGYASFLLRPAAVFDGAQLHPAGPCS